MSKGEINCLNLALREWKRSGGGRRKTQSPEGPPQSHSASLSRQLYLQGSVGTKLSCCQVASTEKPRGPGGAVVEGPNLPEGEGQDLRCPNPRPGICQAQGLKPPGLLRAQASLWGTFVYSAGKERSRVTMPFCRSSHVERSRGMALSKSHRLSLTGSRLGPGWLPHHPTQPLDSHPHWPVCLPLTGDCPEA